MNSLVESLRFISQELPKKGDILNELDGWAGDGDLGVTVSTAASVILGLLPELTDATVAVILRQCGSAVASKAPSTAGTLIAIGMLKAAESATEAQSDATTLARLLEASLLGISEFGGADLGSKTMLDALAPAAAAAVEVAERGGELVDALVAAAAAADTGAKATVTMKPRHGRAGWLAERSVGHEDGGARLIAMLLEAGVQSLSVSE
jgi:dihydroxyacetone kinase-like protein